MLRYFTIILAKVFIAKRPNRFLAKAIFAKAVKIVKKINSLLKDDTGCVT
jgi:hypothetical protein